MADQTFPEPLAVGLGAGLGALARGSLMLAVPTAGLAAEFALVLAVNIVGCFAMGYAKPGNFWGVGFLGGFTTFSALAVAAAQSSALGALAFLVISFVACVAAWLAGDAAKEHHA